MANTPNTMRTNQSGGAGVAGQRAQGEGSSTTEKVKDFATSAADKAREAASSMTDKASEMASDLGDKAECATHAMGSSMQSLAGTLREHAPSSGMLRSATANVADTLDSSGRYLQERSLSGLGNDLTSMIRRNPVPAVLLGIGLGFLLARAARR